MNVSNMITRHYENETLISRRENKPNSNPIKANFPPKTNIHPQNKPNQTQKNTALFYYVPGYTLSSVSVTANLYKSSKCRGVTDYFRSWFRQIQGLRTESCISSYLLVFVVFWPNSHQNKFWFLLTIMYFLSLLIKSHLLMWFDVFNGDYSSVSQEYAPN